jgi:hypothetical protein
MLLRLPNAGGAPVNCMEELTSLSPWRSEDTLAAQSMSSVAAETADAERAAQHCIAMTAIPWTYSF